MKMKAKRLRILFHVLRSWPSQPPASGNTLVKILPRPHSTNGTTGVTRSTLSKSVVGNNFMLSMYVYAYEGVHCYAMSRSVP